MTAADPGAAGPAPGTTVGAVLPTPVPLPTAGSTPAPTAGSTGASTAGSTGASTGGVSAAGTAGGTAVEPGTTAVEVLIVDDQRPFRTIARTVVGMVGGWRVAAEAETGEQAVAEALRIRPAVVLMDINLPGISGIEATRRILAAAPDTRIVLLSTYALDDLPSDAADCGAVAYVNKEDLTPARLRALRPTG
ncbi:response regulator transcription factor [Pseudonocardia ailaonensis]|uniref:response regulator n=1 Tax=Pseudonocardia ailaonensis TaxID=367279 RepID=UPI0031D36328